MSDIVVRKPSFESPVELDDVLPGEKPGDERYLAAFSLTLPFLEPYLIRTYRSVADEIEDLVLAEDVAAFIGQEAQHHRQHRRANETLKEALGPTAAAEIGAIEQDLADDYRRFTDERSRRWNLVYAEGFEAMTCAWAVTSFELAAAGAGSSRSGSWQRMWAWHAAEEIEHRTVAFSVYHELVGSYPYRVLGSIRAQAHFLRYVSRFERAIAAARDERWRPHVPSGIAKGPRRYLRTFLPSYDPADVDPGPLPAMVLAQVVE